MKMVDHFADMFSSTPGLKHLVYHEIKTPPRGNGETVALLTLNLTKGYWLVAPDQAGSQYQIHLFVLHEAPATFQRLMDITLRPISSIRLPTLTTK